MHREIEEKYPEPPDRDDKIHEDEIDQELQAWVKEQKKKEVKYAIEKRI